MKGIAMTAESIIVIVLAVLVLVGFIVFFGNSWNPSQVRVSSTAVQSRLCTDYTQFDPDCNGYVNNDPVPELPVDEKITGISAKIRDVGQNLNFVTCSSTSACGVAPTQNSISCLTCIRDVCKTWCL